MDFSDNYSFFESWEEKVDDEEEMIALPKLVQVSNRQGGENQSATEDMTKSWFESVRNSIKSCGY